LIHPPIPTRFSRLALVAAVVGVAVSGCANMKQARRLRDLPAPVNSPAAQAILDADQHPGRYPTFQEIPPVPQDVRPSQAWRSAVASIKADNATLQAQVAADPPTLSNSEAWAAQKAAQATPPPPPEGPSTEDYARALRDRAKPPPKPK
jgi:hypothetical protein